MNVATKSQSIIRFSLTNENTLPGTPRHRTTFRGALAAVSLLLLAVCTPRAPGDTAPQAPSATAPKMSGATAVTSDAFSAAGTGAVEAPSGVDLKGYKLVWNDEFDKENWTDKSPKGDVKWLSLPSVHGKYIGYQMHDKESMAIKDGIMVNTLAMKSKADVVGSRCAGPVGMKSDAGAELISVEQLGEAKKGDKRLTWGGAGWVGMKFTTPADGLSVSELGLYNIPGSSEEHEIRIFDASTGDDVAKAIVKLQGKPKPTGWVYEPIIGGKKTLAGDHAYYLMTSTLGWNYTKNGYASDPWYDGNTTVKAAGGITVNESEWGNWHSGSLFSIDTTGAGFTQQYGYWEARVKMPAGGVGLWPSWCLYTIGDKSGLSEEVDIFEEYGGAYDSNKDGGFGMRNGHWGKGPKPKNGSANVWPPVSKPWLNWHVYGFLATPTKCAYYVDGDKKGEFDTPTMYLNSPFYMTLEYNNGGGWPITGLIANSHMDVDWVRVWAPREGK